MRPLTLTTPKPLLEVKGKKVIGYVFDALPEEVDEVVIVVKYLGDEIKDHLVKMATNLVYFSVCQNIALIERAYFFITGQEE